MTQPKTFNAFEFNLNANSIIEASAGTGKTYSIVNMFLLLLLQLGKKPIEQPITAKEILLVTFTKNSVAEMQQRVIDRMRLMQKVLFILRHQDNATQDFAQMWQELPELEFSKYHLDKNKILADEFTRLCLEQIYQESRINACYQILERELFSNDFSIMTLDSFIGQALLKVDNELNPSTLKTFPLDKIQDNVDDRRTDLFRSSYSQVLKEQIKAIDLSGLALTGVQVIQELSHKLAATPLATTYKATTKSGKVSLSQEDLSIESDYFTSGLFITNYESFSKSHTTLLNLIISSIYQYISPERIATLYHKYGFDEQTTLLDIYQAKLEGFALFNSLRIFFTHKIINRFLATCYKNKELDLSGKAFLLLEKINPQSKKIIRDLYKFVFIDEFQDTSPVQFDIIDRLFLQRKDEQAQEQSGLIMIGDPKQAIYSFRGADIFNYFKAQNKPGVVQAPTLNRNFRSSQSYVQACNYLFTANRNFFTLPQIKYPLVEAGNKDKEVLALLNEQGILEEVNPLSLITLAQSETSEKKGKKEKQDYPQVLADFIARLLELGQQEKLLLVAPKYLGQATYQGRPVRAQDICLLVHRHDTSQKVATYLKTQYDINSNLKSDFLTASTSSLHEDLTHALKAIFDANNSRQVRRYLYTPLGGKSFAQIQQTLTEANKYNQVRQHLKELKNLWEKQGLFQAFDKLVRDNLIYSSVKTSQNYVENLWQVFNLLFARLQDPTNPQLVFTQLENSTFINDFYSEAQELLAKSNKRYQLNQNISYQEQQEQVTMMTIHGSKGLEFPIVIAWEEKEIKLAWEVNSILPNFEDFYDFSDACQLKFSQDLAGADHARLLYVLLTRAKTAMFYFYKSELIEQNLADPQVMQSYQELITADPYNYQEQEFTSHLAADYDAFVKQQQEDNGNLLLAYYKERQLEFNPELDQQRKFFELMPRATLQVMQPSLNLEAQVPPGLEKQTCQINQANLEVFPVMPNLAQGLAKLLKLLEITSPSLARVSRDEQENKEQLNRLEIQALGQSFSRPQQQVEVEESYIYPSLTSQELSQRLPRGTMRSFSNVAPYFTQQLELKVYKGSYADNANINAQIQSELLQEAKGQTELSDGDEGQTPVSTFNYALPEEQKDFSHSSFETLVQNLPAGAEFGDKMHKIFEGFYRESKTTSLNLDNFCQSLVQQEFGQNNNLISHLLKASLAYELIDLKVLRQTNSLEQAILAAGQDPGSDILRLNVGKQRAVLTEWQFYFNKTARANYERLVPRFIEILARNNIIQLKSQSQLNLLTDQFTGIIDLIIFSEKEIFIIDYKTNYLGTALHNYSSSALKQKMQETGYILQMYIYLAAVYSYCRQHLFFDQPEQLAQIKFVGLHLFIRGFLHQPQAHEPKYGIYGQMPDHQLLQELSDLIVNLEKA